MTTNPLNPNAGPTMFGQCARCGGVLSALHVCPGFGDEVKRAPLDLRDNTQGEIAVIGEGLRILYGLRNARESRRRVIEYWVRYVQDEEAREAREARASDTTGERHE